MSFTHLVNHMDHRLIEIFGVDATLFPQTGGEVPTKGIFAPPALMEDFMPGRGAVVVRFFVRYDQNNPAPAHGDTIQILQDKYDVFEVETDTQGGSTLKLRKNN